MKQLVFDSNKFDAILCLNAELPGESFFNVFDDLPILAADGAAIQLDKISQKADYVIGDMDSFDASEVKNKYSENQLIRVADQDTNDFEKALRFAIEKNYCSILIVGLQGGELEHTLNNWSVLVRYGRMLNLCIFDNYRYGVPIYESITFNTNPQEIVSIIPQPEVTINSTGLKWELANDNLFFGKREGARNVALADTVSIALLKGTALLFLNSRLPNSPRYV